MKEKYHFNILFFIFTLILPTEKAQSSNLQLKWICSNHIPQEATASESCDLYSIDNEKKHKLVLQGYGDLLGHTILNFLNKDLVEIHIGCGSNCTISTFYNNKKEELSASFMDVIAINQKNETLVTVDPYGNVILCSIFGKSNHCLTLLSNKVLSSRSAIFTEAIQKVTFKNQKIYIDYLDKNENKKTTIFPEKINYYCTSSLLQSFYDILTPNFT